MKYQIILRPEPEGGYTVLVPALPGCVTWGKTVKQAQKMAKEAIELYLESLMDHGQPIPDEEGSLSTLIEVNPPFEAAHG